MHAAFEMLHASVYKCILVTFTSQEVLRLIAQRERTKQELLHSGLSMSTFLSTCCSAQSPNHRNVQG